MVELNFHKEKFYNSDFYGKLFFMSYVCENIKNGLKSIINVDFAREYIDELMDLVIEYFNIFANDSDLNSAEKFGGYYDEVRNGMQSVMEIAPLIKIGQAAYVYLIKMLECIVDISENILPENLKLAQFFQRMINSKKQIAEQLGIDEDAFAAMMGKMLDSVDTVNDILEGNKKQDRGTR